MKIVPLYYVRALGGLLYIAGFLMLIYNVYKTIKHAPREEAPTVVEAQVLRYNSRSIGKGHDRQPVAGRWQYCQSLQDANRLR